MNDKERILLVESDSHICDQIADNTLIPLGYKVKVVHEANSAISVIRDFKPHVVINNIILPGLSGKDLMVAINSQGFDTNFIVLGKKGQESEILQAVRLGAKDYLFWPARDAEVVSVVENCLQRYREISEIQRINKALQENRSNDQKNMQHMKILLSVSKELIAISNQDELINRVVEGVVYLGGADMGWVFLYDEKRKKYQLAASCNLPELWMNKLGTTIEDGISSMVAMSGESIIMHGVSLKRFKVANLGQSAAAIPIKINKKVIGMFVLVRNKNLPFSREEISLVESTAELTSLALRSIQQLSSI